jgi:hypothetical protein
MDGAQVRSTPVVPWAHAITGSGPSAAAGTMTSPLATAG